MSLFGPRRYIIVALDHDGVLCFGRCVTYDHPQRVIHVTPGAHVSVVAVTTPEGRLLAVEAMPIQHPAQHPPTVHMRLEHTR